MIKNNIAIIAFIISIIGHSIILGFPGFQIPFNKPDKPDNMQVTIEFDKPRLLPRIRKLGKIKKFRDNPKKNEKISRQGKSQVKDITSNDAMESLNKTEEAMLCFQDIIKQMIEEARQYPYMAKRREIEGIVYVAFTLLANGETIDIKIIKASGSQLLDSAAVNTIKEAGPFPPIPKDLSCNSMPMEVAIVYTLK